MHHKNLPSIPLRNPACRAGSAAARAEGGLGRSNTNATRISHWGIAGFALLLGICAGCTTIPEDSAMPWNTPQPWEGSPSIPGLGDR